ncbi:MarR family transcriptional regulator [Micromonospora sp. C28SCA-DRY-2]|uniref:MarR family transcriptional regulator n=1 Tax=Micromonospora sp. C28SCA-DRY-2 TaxID=3059522 RepID=UPI0026776477|nr:MarR family transcriptional regulator [Micromonospora sp. C28SCA-DRY-2]MDO3700269.1 MarR family transcriptional regulator [Micromonospora sp. C28SCA-DRY-2]
MPAGRLTREDRQYIAARLAEGTPYAEIARHLHRPTSTISREVNRNGGPRRYRSELAQRATAVRARRRPAPGAAAVPPGPASTDGRDPQAVRGVRDELTAMIAHTGLPPMAARVLTELFTTDAGRLTAVELTARLRVSPASISKAVADLERQGLLRRDRHPRQRRDHYVIDDDVWIRAWMASVRMNLLLAAATRRAAAILGPGTPAGGRLHGASQFLEHIMNDMTRAAERWSGRPRPDVR